jgi:transcription elongation factor Elf1
MKEKPKNEQQKESESTPMVIFSCPECGALQWISLEAIDIGAVNTCLICGSKFHQAG